MSRPISELSVNGLAIGKSQENYEKERNLLEFNLETENNINQLNDEQILLTHPVTKGDTILTSVPFAFILKGNLRTHHCDNCLRKKQGLQRCSRCAFPYYCNKDCQKAAWAIHKNECKKLNTLKHDYPPDTARLIARVIFQLQDGGDTMEEKVTDDRNRKFQDLMNHCQQIGEDPRKREHFEAILVVLKGYLGEEMLPDEAQLFEIFGKVYVNSFTMTDRDLNGVGLGVYLAASIFDHSCKPELYASFNGTKLSIRALYDIPNPDLKRLKICYIDVLATREQRMKELKEGYFFTCDCSLCCDKSRAKVMFSINCGNVGCPQPVIINEDSFSCTKCGFSDFDAGTKEKYLRVISTTEEKLSETKTEYFLDVVKSLISLQENLLHKFNIWKVRTLDAAFEAAIAMTEWDSALAYGNENLDGLKFHYGSNHPMYGMSLLKLAKLELYSFKMEQAYKHLLLAEPILLVSHGMDNPVYSADLLSLLKQARQEIAMIQNSGFKVLNN